MDLYIYIYIYIYIYTYYCTCDTFIRIADCNASWGDSNGIDHVTNLCSSDGFIYIYIYIFIYGHNIIYEVG